MLKNMPMSITPEIMNFMMQMGHGDEICIADAHHLAYEKTRLLYRSTWPPLPELLDAILLFSR